MRLDRRLEALNEDVQYLMTYKVSGGYTGGETPVPIPNTEVKPSRADGTLCFVGGESRSLPDLKGPERAFFYMGWKTLRGIVEGIIGPGHDRMIFMDIIRNFCIIAHIDHGKSTLADRFLEITGVISEKEKVEQFLDQMDLERERGITIKASTVRLPYKGKDGREYILNLIDTPGHVDFSYEVSRSLAACEGAILVVDASQGVEAQTLAHGSLALDNGLTVIPVLNKIDLPTAHPEEVKKEIEDLLGLEAHDAFLVSAKEGQGVKEVLDAVVERVPSPRGDPGSPLKALIFDSWFDPYQGAIVLVRIFQGKMTQGRKIMLMSSGKVFEIQKLGLLAPGFREVSQLTAGEVGVVIAGIKEVRDTKIGDTITEAANSAQEPLPGFQHVKPMVFCGLYPVEPGEYESLRDAVEKLRLNDSSFTYEAERSSALGFGFRCGFLGLLHMEIVQERLEREFALSLITTSPTVVYRVTVKKGEVLTIDNPSRFPPEGEIKSIEEPIILASIYTPGEYIGSILKLCEERRGVQKEIKYLSKGRALILYEIPLNEIVLDFYDRLKSVSRGYASLDYDFVGHRESNMVRLDILVNGEVVDALSSIVPREKAYYRGKELLERLRNVIPRQLFEVILQAAIGGKVIARETKKALRKDVTAKCYGGDITRKRKLLERQKEGKKRMKQIGRVEIPQEAFLAVLKVGPGS